MEEDTESFGYLDCIEEASSAGGTTDTRIISWVYVLAAPPAKTGLQMERISKNRNNVFFIYGVAPI